MMATRFSNAWMSRRARSSMVLATRKSSTTTPPPQVTIVEEAYTRVVSTMHWLVAPAFLASIGCVLQAQQVKGKEKGQWMFYHKSFGLLSGILIAPRILARLTSKIPGPVAGSKPYEEILAKLSHAAMYGFMIVMPATGIAMGYYGGKGLPFFTTTLKGAEKPNGDIAKQAFSIHKPVGVYGKFLIPLHIAGAGFHAIKGQAVFARINPFK